MPRETPQAICFSYHKSGTTLLLHVMTRVCKALGLRIANYYGRVEHIDPEPDVVLLPHAIVVNPPAHPYRAIRVIRDPRDIWVSGYLYHLHSIEEWCINTDLTPTPPVGWPKVDYSFAHWPEDWKIAYLQRLGDKSYQQNLLQRDLASGLEFELQGYTGCTLATMRDWPNYGIEALDIRLEDAMVDFPAVMRRIFTHFGLSAEQVETAVAAASPEDIRGMDDADIAARPQIYSRTISKWRDILPPEQLARFEREYGDLIETLGYERACAEAEIPSLPPPPNAEVWLNVDGAPVRPLFAKDGVYRFALPANSQTVRLESLIGIEPGRVAPFLGAPRRRGLFVSHLAVRSGATDTPFPIDHPALTSGWHEPERDGNRIGRWTSGSAAIPWTPTAVPAILIVRAIPFDPAGKSREAAI